MILRKLIDENEMIYNYYVNRYIDLGNTVFSCDNMNHLMDSLLTMVTPEMPAQCARWGTSMATWQANVQVLRNFIDGRCITTQQGLIDCYDLEGPFNVTFQVEPPLTGTISINSITPPVYPFTGVYYGGITTGLVAQGVDGNAFDHWELNNHVLSPSELDSIVTLEFTTTDTMLRG